ncbi:MAG: alpha/beta hydrolase [Cyclobacteriaceae bacterium]
MTLIGKKIQANGINVGYLEQGVSTGIPLIFIHGFPFNKEMWSTQLTALSDSHRCIAYDVRGHGDSEAGAAQFIIPQFADDLFSFLDALKIDKAIVVGLSMGGYIALHAIKKNPTRIAGLLLCDTQCASDTQEGRDKRKKTIAFIQKNGLEVYTEESLKNLFAPGSLQSKKEEVQFIRNTILKTRPESICLTLQALADRAETCSALEQIKVPVLILVGKEDKITSPEMAEKMHRLINNSELQIIENAGHLSNLENPEQFNEHIKSFLSNNFK